MLGALIVVRLHAIAGLQDGTPAHAPTWFLSAIAPNAVGTEVDSCLTRLTRQAEEEFVRQGNAKAAWTALEAGILQVCSSTCYHL